MKSFAKLPILLNLLILAALFSGCSSDRSGKVSHTEFCRGKYEKAEAMFKEGIRKTIQWFFENEDWMKNVTSGDYQKYYEDMYKDK